MKRQRKRGVTDIPGMHSMRTTSRRSIPRAYQSSSFVELYMLTKERERLEKETAIMQRRKGVIERRLGDIGREMQKLKGAEAKKTAEGRAIRKSIPTLAGHTPKEWRRMALHY